MIYSGLGNAVKKIDLEVSKVENWNRQGSTLSAIFINKIRAKSRNSEDCDGDRVVDADDYDDINDINTVKHRTTHTNNIIENQRKNEDSEVENDYSILTVNVGDSRIVLARGRKAIDLTCDHKPNMRSGTVQCCTHIALLFFLFFHSFTYFFIYFLFIYLFFLFILLLLLFVFFVLEDIRVVL